MLTKHHREGEVRPKQRYVMATSGPVAKAKAVTKVKKFRKE
jgi:hypothetical protein